jgi:hypothetical protein
MIIQLQFSEIMGCANLFQRFFTLAVYCVSTPSIIKNIIELKCNIELEIRFKTKQITHIAHVFMKLHLCTSQVTCTRVKKNTRCRYAIHSPGKKSLKQICTTHDFTELKLNNHLLFTFYSSIQMN